MMDAVKFVEERRRMFAVTGEVSKYIRAEDIVKEVEEWSAAHPRKTRQSVFLERYPEALVGDSGVLNLCPMYISAEHRDMGCLNIKIKCKDCRREFWMEEV